MTDANASTVRPSTNGPAQRSADWGAKAILVFVLAVLMAIPGVLVFGLVLDRQHRAETVTQQVSALQGGPQQLLGPMLIAPYVAPKPPANDANGVPHPQPPDTGWYVVSPDRGTVDVSREGLVSCTVASSTCRSTRRRRTSTRHSRRRRKSVNLPAGAAVDWQAARLVVGLLATCAAAKSDISGVFSEPAGKTPIVFSPTTGLAWAHRAHR